MIWRRFHFRVLESSLPKRLLNVIQKVDIIKVDIIKESNA
jgi:hypothetical protein